MDAAVRTKWAERQRQLERLWLIFPQMVFQAAPVTQALGSVKRICQSGHRVIFDDEDSYVQNKITGEVNMLREEDGNYILDAWILPSSTTGFAGLP